MALILQDVGDALAQADRFYMHDGEFLFPYAYQHIPTVVSLRDNVYPETLLGGYLFQGDHMILISEYSRKFVEATMGRFLPELSERIEVIHNGLDWSRFKPTPAGDILKFLPFDPSQHPVIVHPHRPEDSKGMLQTVAVVDLLVNTYGHRTLKTLMPRWLDIQHSADLQAWYDHVQAEIDRRGIRDNIVMHDWIPQRLMPEYLSLGALTLSLGHFAETFGNAVYESLGCGTPTIAARITTHRELLPEHLLDKVDFDDAETAAAIADEILRTGRRTSPETMAYLHAHYGTERQLSAYADVIINARIAEPLTYRHPVRDSTTPHRLAPWCYVREDGRVYHDFRADATDLGELVGLLRDASARLSQLEAQHAGIDAARFEQLYRDGFLIPVN
jgi:glycosyltransferase involved in cell wall biosynthesis